LTQRIPKRIDPLAVRNKALKCSLQKMKQSILREFDIFASEKSKRDYVVTSWGDCGDIRILTKHITHYSENQKAKVPITFSVLVGSYFLPPFNEEGCVLKKGDLKLPGLWGHTFKGGKNATVKASRPLNIVYGNNPKQTAKKIHDWITKNVSSGIYDVLDELFQQDLPKNIGKKFTNPLRIAIDYCETDVFKDMKFNEKHAKRLYKWLTQRLPERVVFYLLTEFERWRESCAV